MELKKKIAEWRVRYVTRWNRYCIQAFRRLLVQLVHDLDFVTDILSVKREVIFMMMMIIMIIIIIYLWQRRRYMFLPARPRSFVCLSVCVQDYSKTRAWIWMKCCVSTDVGTWTIWLTFEPDADHSPYRLWNFAALPSLAYFSVIFVSICAKLARSILMRDRNTATEPNFQKLLSKCRILSSRNSYLSISHVNQQQHCSSVASLDRSITSVRPMTARSIFSISVFTFLITSSLF